MPKVLFYDIETAMMLIEGHTYSRKQYSNFLPSDWIKRDVWLPCVAWQWMDENYIASVSVLSDKERFKNAYYDDYHVVKTLRDLINEAEAVIAHNGDNFDWKILQGRCLYHGLEPPAKPILIDTLKIARKEFKIGSNELKYLARFLKVSEKDKAPDWSKIAVGCPKEIARATVYCRQDIRTLRAVYEKIRPYSTNHPNLHAAVAGQHHEVCPKCGHWDLINRGARFNKARTIKRQRVSCNMVSGGCGSWHTLLPNLLHNKTKVRN